MAGFLCIIQMSPPKSGLPWPPSLPSLPLRRQFSLGMEARDAAEHPPTVHRMVPDDKELSGPCVALRPCSNGFTGFSLFIVFLAFISVRNDAIYL